MLPTRSGVAHPEPLGPVALMDAAAGFGLAGVEFALPSGAAAQADALMDALLARNLRLIADFMILLDAEPDTFRDYLRLAAKLGAKVVRALLSTTLCGD